LAVSSLGFDFHPGDWYFVLVCGQLAEKLLDHKACLTQLADRKMSLHGLMG
jgi:hypothetical protein